uniref:Major sperm protein n=1 Tax=Panagrolaimus sp. ES5 TaxID=591445 RepID=A0AC34FCP9_9BILA
MSEPEQSKSPDVGPPNPAAAENAIKSVTASEASDLTNAADTVPQQPAAVVNSQISASAAAPIQSTTTAAVGTQLSDKKEPSSNAPPQQIATQQQPSTSPPSHAPAVQSPQPPLAAAPAFPRSSPVIPKTVPTLCINPNKAVFTTAGGVSKHLMINKSNLRLAIKIRSSNNFFFRVNPVYSFLDCNAVNELEVIRLVGGGAKQDKLQVIYVTCAENDTDPTKLFGLRANVRSVILPIVTTAASSL